MPGSLPPGCNAGLPAVAFRPGPIPVDAPAAPIPCAQPIGFPGGEPTLGITSDGTVWVYPTTDVAAPGGRGPAFSRDGGATWQRSLVSEAGVPVRVVSLDPYMLVDPTTDRIWIDDLFPTNCSQLAWSDDHGASWTQSLAGCLAADHQTLFTGPATTSTTLGYPHLLYHCAINGGALAAFSATETCQRSLDGGLTWLPPGGPAFVSPPGILPATGLELPGCTGGNGHGATDPQGRVYLPRGHCGQPWLALSDDEGLSWTTVQVADNGMNDNGGAGSGHDFGIAADASGHAYAFWVASDLQPYLAVSRDRGATWGAPVLLAPPGLVEASHPEIAIGGDGRLAWVYMGTADPADAALRHWTGYIGMTLDALATAPLLWTGPVTDAVANPYVMGTCGATRCSAGSGDFFDVRIAPDGTPWGAFIDDCQGACDSDGSATSSREVVAVHLVGGPSLWGPDDANGPYPNP